jgi:TonB family protein
MKQISLVLCTLVMVVSGTKAQTTTQSESTPWTEYTIQGEDFSVAMPNLPALHTETEYLDSIDKSRKKHILAAYADGVVYVLHVFENPKPRQSLDSFIEARGFSNVIRAGFRDVTVDGFSGKANPNGAWQAFATEDRFFEMRAFGPVEGDPGMTKFFSSVSLRKKKESVEVIDGPGLPWEPPAEPESSNDETTKNIYIGKDVTRKARLGSKPQPSYTAEARKHGVTGTVVLKCVFARNGSVTNIRIVSGLPNGLTERAIDAAQKIKFIPAMKDGKYVSMWIQLEYNFNLY